MKQDKRKHVVNCIKWPRNLTQMTWWFDANRKTIWGILQNEVKEKSTPPDFYGKTEAGQAAFNVKDMDDFQHLSYAARQGFL